jgi:colicin import membrane protein
VAQDNAAAASNAALPAVRSPRGPHAHLLESWPRVAEAIARAGLQTEEALLGANLSAIQTFVLNDRRGLESWADATQQAQTAAVELWGTLLEETEQFGRALAIELSYSAVDLLDRLEQETTARARLEEQRERERERAETERTRRQQAERERDDEQRRADSEHRARLQAERKLAELEAEVKATRERGAKAEPPAVNVVHREDDWAVVREDAKRASGVFGTKREALQRAREIARREGAEVQVQKADTSHSEPDDTSRS